MDRSLYKRRIDRNILRANDYLASLLEAAYDASLITEYTVNKVKTDCMELLASRAALFTEGKSSSVPVETAQLLLDSVTHTIGVYLRSLPSPEDAASYLENGKFSVFRSFCLGLRMIENSYKAAKKRYIRLKKHIIKTPNEFYISTLSSGITAFFKNYSPSYASHITNITADYRPLLPTEDVSGMEFMKIYIDRLYTENAFLDIIGDEAVHRAMYSYDTSYASQLFNLFETVLLSCLVPVSAGKSLNGLKPNARDRAALVKKLESLNPNELASYIAGLTRKLCDIIDADEMIASYITECLPVLTAKISAYIERGMTVSLFVSKPPETESTKYIDGEQMSDAKYDELVSEVMQCATSEKKMELIFGSVRSVADLADVIRDAYLDENEIKYIKSRLSSEENELLESYI